MSTIIVPRVAIKGMNKGALRGPLICPHMGCDGTAHKYVENVSTYRVRYRCGKCRKTFQYDFTNNLEHPYKVFGKSKWQKIVQAWEDKKGTRPLGRD